MEESNNPIGTMEDAAALLNSLYARWPNERMQVLLRDHEPSMNLAQMYLQTWYLFHLSKSNTEAAWWFIQIVTQACFIMGYEYAKQEMQIDNSIPDSIKNLDVSDILE